MTVFLVGNRVAVFLGPLAGGMDWAVASGEPSWGAAADQGPTMVSFGGPSSSIFPTAEIQFQDFSVGIVRRARPPGAGRRSRGAGSGGVPEACSVDGCRSDLSRCRDYHRRHKVCETHSKTPVVVVGGQEQRFCQQCSRFHMLSEFDEGKRSCRKRLDGHNRRRRKPQHDVMNFGGFFPYHQVNQFAMHPQSIARSGQNSNCKHLVDCQQTFSISFSGTFKAPKAIPFCQDGGSMLNALCSNNHPAAHGSHTRSISLSGTLAPECALSLLSSSLHHPSPSTDQAQVTSSLTCLVAAPQDATTTTTIPYASSVAHHGFVPDALFEDPSQPLPFIW